MTKTQNRERPARHAVATAPETPSLSLEAWANELVTYLHGHPAVRPDVHTALQAQLADLRGPAPPPQASDPCQPVIVRTEEDLERVGARAKQEQVVAIDLETSDLDPGRGVIVGVGLAGADFSCYVPIAHRLEGSDVLAPDQLPLAEVVEILGLAEARLVAHNSKFELRWLRRHAGIEPHLAWDTMLAGQLLRSDLPAELKAMAMRELDVPDWGLSVDELKRIQYLPIERVARYCAKDALYTIQLMRRQQACLV